MQQVKAEISHDDTEDNIPTVATSVWRNPVQIPRAWGSGRGPGALLCGICLYFSAATLSVRCTN